VSYHFVGRIAAGAIVGWYCAFIAVLTHWGIGEQMEPGQQYADPLLPSLFCGYVFGVAPGILVAGLTARRH
jgi:hypothetical protein